MTSRNKRLLKLSAATTMALAAWATTTAQAAPPTGEIRIAGVKGTVIIPATSIARPEDAGVRAHTNIRLFMPAGHATPAATAPSGGYENPASVACLYGLTTPTPGCNPTTLTKVATGGSKVIAIVDAYDDPNAASDLGAFSAQYGLPPVTAANFQVVYATGVEPPIDHAGLGGWELEESLDIEMAHALAPSAKVILVEAASNSTADLLYAEGVAAQMVAAAGGGQVSNSWGGTETSTEEQMESDFSTAGVTFFASTGDAPGTEFPSILTNVVAVGGTTVNRDASFNYINQTAWSDTGGGSSAYVPVPSYQAPVASIVGSKRGVPDIALVADPNSGVWIYDTNKYEFQVLKWVVVGGTSVAARSVAAIVDNSAACAPSSPALLTKVYKGFKKSKNFTDVVGGTCGSNGGATAVAGWDFCTGVGTPLGRYGK